MYKKIIIDKLKAMLKGALQKEMSTYKKEDAKLFFIWQKETSSIGFHIISKKFDALENSVLSRPVAKLSSLMNALEVASYKALGFNVDVDAVKYIQTFYINYCKSVGIDKSDCNFYIALDKGEPVAVFNPKLETKLAAKRVDIDEIIKIGSNG